MRFDTMHSATMTSVEGDDDSEDCEDSDTLFMYLQMRDFLSQDTNVCLQIVDINNAGVFNSNFSKIAVDDYEEELSRANNGDDSSSGERSSGSGVSGWGSGRRSSGRGIYSLYQHASTRDMEKHHFYDMKVSSCGNSIQHTNTIIY